MGRYQHQYSTARLDLIIAISSEAKFRAHKEETIRDENAVRLQAAYLTISSLPSWITVFQRGTESKYAEKHRSEQAAIMHDVILEHFGIDVPTEQFVDFLKKHLNKSEHIVFTAP